MFITVSQLQELTSMIGSVLHENYGNRLFGATPNCDVYAKLAKPFPEPDVETFIDALMAECAKWYMDVAPSQSLLTFGSA